MRAVVAAVAVLLATAGCASGGSERRADDAASEVPRVRPAPTSSLFTPAPFEVPTDAPGFWTALQDIGRRLPATAPVAEAQERTRLQACDHLSQLTEAAFLGDRDDYRLGPTSNLYLRSAANSCPDDVLEAHELVQRVLQEDPFTPP